MTMPFQPTDADAEMFGNRFLTREVPTDEFPDGGMSPTEAMRLVGEDIALEGDPARNLATFVTTWMEPEAQRIIASNLHRNFIDHAEYPRTAEIEQRCIRMLADLYHAPGKTTGARTQGSSEAIMLGSLSLKWNWRKRREAAGLATTCPELVHSTHRIDPSSPSIAGVTCHWSRSATYSLRARSARVRDGARSARSITFLGVCSVATNSITSTR